MDLDPAAPDSPQLPAEMPAPTLPGLPAPSFTPTQIAADWGCSRAYASKKIKEGCPVDTLEAAREWRVKKSRRGVGYRSKHRKAGLPESVGLPSEQVETVAGEAVVGDGGAVVETVAGEPPVGDGGDSSLHKEESEVPALDLDTIDESLKAAISVEKEAHRLVVIAQKAKDDEKCAIRISAYSKALDGRLSAEKKVQEIKERSGILITSDFAKQLIRKAWLPLLTRLRSIPKRASIKANPTDDVLAELVISEEIEDAIREAKGAFED
jgi:hypothetical protein